MELKRGARVLAASMCADLRRAIERLKEAMREGVTTSVKDDLELLHQLEQELARWQATLDEITESVMRVGDKVIELGRREEDPE